MALTKNGLLCAYDPTQAPIAAVGSADDPSFPASKLLSDDLFDSWRSAPGSLSAVKITLTLAAPTTVAYAALMGFNGRPGSCTRRLELAQLSDPTFAADLWDSGTAAAWDVSVQPAAPYTPPWGRNLVVFPPAVANVSFVRWTLTDPTPGVFPPAVPGAPLPTFDNHLRADIARVGSDSWQPAAAPWNPNGVNFDDGWTQAPVVGGDSAAPIVQRGHQFNFKAASEADESFLMALACNLRGLLRVLVVPRPLNPSAFLRENIWATPESSSGGGSPAGGSSPIASAVPVASFVGKAKSVQLAFREVCQ